MAHLAASRFFCLALNLSFRTFLRARACALRVRAQPADHGMDSSKLRTRFQRIVGTGITEPVAATFRTERNRGRNRLRVKDDDVVRVGPVVVISLRIEIVSDYDRRRPRLPRLPSPSTQPGIGSP